MTPVRRVAVAISGLVVRYASSGCKEWAEGLAREVEIVEGDWAALGWAIGSMRVLLNRDEAPMSSLEEIRDRTAQLERWVRRRTSGYIVLFLVAVFNVQQFIEAAGFRQRIGYGLAVIAATGMGITLLIRRHLQLAPANKDPGNRVLSYRSELERQRDFYRSTAGLAGQAGMVLYGAGIYLVHSGLPKTNVPVHLIFGMAGVLISMTMICSTVYEWLKFQEQIDALDAVIKKSLG